jgi:pimeloyl-ACP methyl ester carboxylesterase
MADAVPAILVPGLDGTGELFDPLIAALGSRFAPRCVRFDDQARSWEQHVATVERALGAVDRPALLVAESFGGPVAVAATARHPERVRGLLLVATFLVRPSWNTGLILPWYRFVMGIAWPNALRRRVLLALLATPDLDAATVQRLFDVNSHERAPLLAHRLGLCVDVDVRAEFGSLRCPVGYVGGRADRIVPVLRHAEIVRALQPTAIVELLADAPHMILQCRPAACAAVARRLGSKSP